MKLLVALVAVALFARAAGGQAVPSGSLPSFGSDGEYRRYMRDLGADYRRREEARRQAMAANQTAALVACGAGKPTVSRTANNPAAVIHGTVRDAAGTAIPVAAVTIPALGLSTTAASDGRYRLAVASDSLTSARTVTLRTLRIGYVGRYDTVTIARGDSIRLDFRMCAVATSLNEVVTSSAFAAKDESITNNQHAGVDEGGIVKLHGNYLIVLRRGRLFTIEVGDERMRAVSTINAFAPGVTGAGDWYDELLTYEDRVIVVGYSYARDGTEINSFRIDPRGRLTYESTHHLRSNDYYSATNYASRLVGNKLVFYSPLHVPFTNEDPLAALPALRRWDRSANGGEFRRIASAGRVYRSPIALRAEALALHTVTSCDLDRPALSCEASVVVGPPGRVFYVSPTAVYVWLSEWHESSESSKSSSFVYRLPLDGTAPSALGVRGAPVDQFSFLEQDGYLNVAVRSQAFGDEMWLRQFADGDISLLRVPLSEFGNGTTSARRHAYRALPQPMTTQYREFTNRFVGEHLVYGTGNGWGVPQGAASPVFIAPIRGGRVSTIQLEHGADRIEVMGSDVVVVGSDSVDLHFTGITLAGRPRIAQRYVLGEASQGETRSHGFYYKPNAEDARYGTFGLPVRRAGRPGYEHLVDESSAIVYLRNTGDRFVPLGDLSANDATVRDDRCEASCVDWYGNSRPLFLRGRTFALMGYELVEGRVTGNRIREIGRLNFAP